jgi:hypothetical protein
MSQREKPDLSEYSPEQLRELAREKERAPYNEDLQRVIDLAKEIAEKHQKTAKMVLNACVGKIPKTSR